MKIDTINALFANEYPRPDEKFERDVRGLPARQTQMVPHMCRTNHGDILMGFADTGRPSLPPVPWDESRSTWLCHGYPQLNCSGGWHTRFDAGRDDLGLPSTVVVIYAEGNETQVTGHAHSTFYKIARSWALVLRRMTKGSGGEFATREILLDGPLPTDTFLFKDDGLEACQLVLRSALDPEFRYSNLCLPTLREDAIDYDVLERMYWAKDHMLDSFGQGPIVRPRRKRR